MVAAGHIELAVETGLNSYDIAPLIPVIQCAGGEVVSWNGGSAAEGGKVDRLDPLEGVVFAARLHIAMACYLF